MRDLKGEDLTLSLTDVSGAIIEALGIGIEDFQVQMLTDKIEANNLDGRRIGQVFKGWKGSFNLNLRNSLALTFWDAYQAALVGGLDHRVVIGQSVWDPTLGVKRRWTYRNCVLDFSGGTYTRTSTVKLKVEFETGEARIPG